MRYDFSPQALRQRVDRLSDLELARVRYCYQIGSTFVSVALLEDAVITSMLMCERVKVSTVLADDAPKWERLLRKHEHLKESTRGSLIALLSKHDLVDADLAYLRWLKTKRDFFIHQYFHLGLWPGDLNEEQIDRVCRMLGALELVFQRGAHRMMKVLGRAGLMKLHVIPGSGIIAYNPGMLDEGDK